MNDEKYRRMEIRRKNGTRVVNPPAPPNYHRGPEYLIAHACFSCLKSFKMNSLEEGNHKCPECKGVVYEMGRSFTAPRKSDVSQWKKVHRLYSEGFRFFGSGFHASEKLPNRLSDLEDFLERNKEHYLKVAEPNYDIKFNPS